MVGEANSALDLMYSIEPFSTSNMVISCSISTLYHWDFDIVVTFKGGSFFTFLMVLKKEAEY